MDAYVYDLRCRLCAGDQPLGMNIFSEQATKMEVKRKIYQYIGLEVDIKDTLPKNICYLCLGHIEEFDKFKRVCSEAQLTLKNWTQCLDDEDMSFNAECNDTPVEGTEVNGCNITANPAECSSGRCLEESGNEHTFSSKKRQKTYAGTSHKVKSNNTNERLVTKGSSETFANATLSRYNIGPSRRIRGSHNKSTNQRIVLEDFTTSDDDDEEDEVGFPGFVAGRNLDMDCSPPVENETVGKNNREREQTKFSGPDYYAGTMQDSQTDSEGDLLCVVKQEPVDEIFSEHECTVCHRIFTRIATFQQHLDMHLENDPCDCPTCGRQFRSGYGLVAHLSTHQNEEYKCCECRKEFSQEKTLIEHVQNNHGVKDKVTSTSNTQFLQNTAKIQNKKHEKQKTYRCKFCEANFQDKSNVTDHMRCHFAEKPYSCNLCDRRFTRHQNLMAHLKVHRDKTSICRLCMSSFSSKAELTEHLSEVHRDVMLEIVNDADHGSSNL